MTGDEYGRLTKRYDRKKPKCSKNYYFQFRPVLSTTIPAWTELESNPRVYIRKGPLTTRAMKWITSVLNMPNTVVTTTAGMRQNPEYCSDALGREIPRRYLHIRSYDIRRELVKTGSKAECSKGKLWHWFSWGHSGWT
jgi:hypothetical protein